MANLFHFEREIAILLTYGVQAYLLLRNSHIKTKSLELNEVNLITLAKNLFQNSPHPTY